MLREFFNNPVVTKELRGRMRGARTYWLLFGYVLLLSLILFISYLGWWNQHSQDLESGGGSEGFTVGRNFFKTLLYSQAVMMALITPALTAGAISVEREQRTFELLRGSVLRPGAIVWGKLSSAVSFVVLLLTSSLPLLSLCFLLGGVSPGEVFFAYLLLICDAFLFGAIGLCWSAYAAGTATATVLSYATLIVFFVVTFPFSIPALDETGSTPNAGFSALNPIGAVTGAVTPEHYYRLMLPAWVPALLLNGALTALLILAAMNRLEDFPTRRAAALRAVTLLFAGLLVFFGCGVVEGFTGGVFFSEASRRGVELGLMCAVLLLLVPVLVTGDFENEGRGKWWSPKRIFRDATLPSGLPLALLLLVVVGGLTLAGTHFGAQPAQTQIGMAPAFHGPNFAGPNTGRRFTTASPSVGSLSQTDALTEQTAGMMFLVILGISGLGFFLSALLNNRWTSLTLLFLVLVFSMAVPYFSYSTLNGQDAVAAARSPAVNSLYLCPLVPIQQMTDTLEARPSFGRDSAVVGMIGYGALPLWIGTGLVYLVIGAACYAAGLALLRQRRATRSA